MKPGRLGPLAAAALAGWLPAQFRAEVSMPGAAAGTVAFGAPFALVVERQWPDGWTPQPFDDGVLAPLLVEAPTVDVERGDGGRWTERRRYTARATAVGALVGKAWPVRFRGPDGDVRQLEAVLPPLRVTSVLPTPPGDVEWAFDVRDEPWRRGWLWAAVALCALGLGGLWWRGRRALPVPGVAAPPPAGEPAPHAAALAALRALASPGDADRASIAAFYGELARIVREYAGARFGVPALVRTSEELGVAVSVGRVPLAECLAACDLVKFAAARPAPAAHAAAHAAACRFVDLAAPPPAAEVRS